jgi:hypothetical protein
MIVIFSGAFLGRENAQIDPPRWTKYRLFFSSFHFSPS